MTKKGVVFISLLATLWLGWAYAQSATLYQGPKPPALSNGFVRGVQRLLGIDALAGWLAENQLETQIHKKVQGNLKIHLHLYSTLDLSRGRLKALSLTGKSLIIKHTLYISTLTLHTLPDTPIWIDPHTGKLKAPVHAMVDLTLTDTDLAQTFATRTVLRKLSHLSVPLAGMEKLTLQFVNPQAHCLNNAFDLQGTLSSPDNPSGAYALHMQSQVALADDGTRLLFPNLTIMNDLNQPNESSASLLFQALLAKGIRPAKLFNLLTQQVHITQLVLNPGQVHIVANIWLLPPRKPDKNKV